MTFGLAVTVYGGSGNVPSRFWHASLRVLTWLQCLWLVGHDRKHWDLKRRERWRERRRKRRSLTVASAGSRSHSRNESSAVSEYLPVIISAVSLAPKNGPAYKLLNDFIYRNKSCYSVVPEPELEQDSSKINETGQNMSGASGIFDGKNPEPIKPFDHIVSNTWTCRFCGGTFADRTLAIKHAIDCDDNEDVHSCATCASYEIGEDTRDGYRHMCKGNPKRIDTWMKHCPEWIGA